MTKLSQLRIAAHRSLDLHWQELGLSRAEAYARLAAAMGIPPAACHIAQFDELQCRRVIYLCHPNRGALSGALRAKSVPDLS